MQYILLIYQNEEAGAKLTKAENEAIYKEYMDYTQELRAAKAMVAGDPLQPTSTATTIRVKNGDVVHSDGPFAETREQLGGYYLIEAADLDEALKWGAKCPAAKTGSVEVRPVMNML